MPVDIVFLCLHGAQMAEAIDDCEGALIAAVREIVGPGVAIGVLLDLHANVTSAMCTHADLTVSCREYPHVDYAERALGDAAGATRHRPCVRFDLSLAHAVSRHPGCSRRQKNRCGRSSSRITRCPGSARAC